MVKNLKLLKLTMLLIQLKMLTAAQQMDEIENKTPDHDKYITTLDVNKLTT